MTISPLHRLVQSHAERTTFAAMKEAMVKMTNEDGRALRADTDQLRLAFLELGRISREIDALQARPDVSAHHPLLTSLRACRAALLRMADARMQGRSRHSLELSFDETQLS